MRANRIYNENGECVKFTAERNGEFVEIVTDRGIKFCFSEEVGVATAITCLVHKTLLQYLAKNYAFNYNFELKVTKKK